MAAGLAAEAVAVLATVGSGKIFAATFGCVVAADFGDALTPFAGLTAALPRIAADAACGFTADFPGAEAADFNIDAVDFTAMGEFAFVADEEEADAAILDWGTGLAAGFVTPFAFFGAELLGFDVLVAGATVTLALACCRGCGLTADFDGRAGFESAAVFFATGATGDFAFFDATTGVFALLAMAVNSNTSCHSMLSGAGPCAQMLTAQAWRSCGDL